MSRHEDQTFKDQRIVLDGNEYQRCTFDNCEIVIDATGDKTIIDCKFIGCRWDLDGPAQRTVKDLARLYQMPGMKDVIEGLFDMIRQGPPAGPATTLQ
jgi:hypothetical protein